MPRNGSDVYSLPAGSIIANGDISDASDINTPIQDLETDMNTPRPVVAGGTGASSASAARTALGVEIGADVQAYNADTMFSDEDTTVTATHTVTGTVDLSGGTLTLADGQIAGVKVGAATDANRGAAKLYDEDDMASDATDGAPSQQSVKAYVDAITDPQTLLGTSAPATGVARQNTTDHLLFVHMQTNGGTADLSPDNSTWTVIVDQRNFDATLVVPPGYYYRSSYSTVSYWNEIGVA